MKLASISALTLSQGAKRARLRNVNYVQKVNFSIRNPWSALMNVMSIMADIYRAAISVAIAMKTVVYQEHLINVWDLNPILAYTKPAISFYRLILIMLNISTFYL